MSAAPKEKAPRAGAKKPRVKGDVPALDKITLEYSLAELPSAQHRAGLAGLVLMLRWLDRLPNASEGTCHLARVDEFGATIELDRVGLKRLLDETYDATNEEQAESQLRKDKKTQKVVPPIREGEQTTVDSNGKSKTKKLYFYPVTVPKAAMLIERDPTRDGDRGLWVKLWRDMVWSTLRGVPATREPFEARADKREASDVASVWAQLLQPSEKSVELPSTYYLGAQSSTAENVEFRDRGRYQFLLHFWPYSTQVYVPAALDLKDNKRAFVGFALAIPDVGALATFCGDFAELLLSRGTAAAGFRPRDAVIDLAVESALDMSARLRERVARREGARETRDVVLGFDVFHVAKEGNNVRMLSSSRVEPHSAMTDEYQRIRTELWDPLFRRTRLLNLVHGRPWYAGFDTVAATVPYESQFIGSKEFRHDARVSFRAMEKGREGMEQEQEEGSVGSLEDLVYRVVKRYVAQKTAAKSGISDWKVAEERGPAEKAKYDECRSKIANSAFLGARSRTGDDFIEYFAGTLCSVNHRLKREQFVELSRALRHETANVRTLTLLALSTHGG